MLYPAELLAQRNHGITNCTVFGLFLPNRDHFRRRPQQVDIEQTQSCSFRLLTAVIEGIYGYRAAQEGTP